MGMTIDMKVPSSDIITLVEAVIVYNFLPCMRPQTIREAEVMFRSKWKEGGVIHKPCRHGRGWGVCKIAMLLHK